MQASRLCFSTYALADVGLNQWASHPPFDQRPWEHAWVRNSSARWASLAALLVVRAAEAQPRLSDEHTVAPVTIGLIQGDHPAVAANAHSALIVYRGVRDRAIHAFWQEEFIRSLSRDEITLAPSGEDPRVAWDGARYVAVWSALSAAGAPVVQGIRFEDAALGPLGSRFEISNATAPALACGRLGCLVVFQRGEGGARTLRALRVPMVGDVVVSDDALVATLAGADDVPLRRVAADEAGFLVAWKSGADRIDTRRLGSDGRPLADVRTIDGPSTRALAAFDLAFDGTRYRLLAQTAFGLYALALDPAGGAGEALTLGTLSDASEGALAPPALAMQSGRPVALWSTRERSDAGSADSVWAQILDARTPEEELGGAKRRVVALRTATHALGVAVTEQNLFVTYDDSPVEPQNPGRLAVRSAILPRPFNARGELQRLVRPTHAGRPAGRMERGSLDDPLV